MLSIKNKEEFKEELSSFLQDIIDINKNDIDIYEKIIEDDKFSEQSSSIISHFKSEVEKYTVLKNKILENIEVLFKFIQNNKFLFEVIHEEYHHSLYLSIKNFDIPDETNSKYFFNIFIKNQENENLASIFFPLNNLKSRDKIILNFDESFIIENMFFSLYYMDETYLDPKYIFFKNKVNTNESVKKFQKLIKNMEHASKFIHSISKDNNNKDCYDALPRPSYKNFTCVEELTDPLDAFSTSHKTPSFDWDYRDSFINILSKNNTISKEQLGYYFSNIRQLGNMLKSFDKKFVRFIFDEKNYSLTISLEFGDNWDFFLLLKVDFEDNLRSVVDRQLIRYKPSDGYSDVPMTLKDYLYNQEEVIKSIKLMYY